MRLFFILLLLFPVPAISQSIESLIQPKMKELHTRTFTACTVDSGEQKILYKSIFDTSGRKISSYRVWNNPNRTLQERDTIIYRGDSSIYISRNGGIDSSITIYDPDGSPYRMITREYEGGKIVSKHLAGGDSLFSYLLILNSRPNELTLKFGNCTRKTYDKQGREITRLTYDSTIYSERTFVTEESYVETVYDHDLIIRKSFEMKDGKRRLKYTEYYDNNGRDSTIHYDHKGRITAINVAVYDSIGRNISYVSKSGRGKLNYMITWERNDSMMVQKTYNAKMKVDRTFTTYYLPNGLIEKEVETGIEGNSEVFYTYTFW